MTDTRRAFDLARRLQAQGQSIEEAARTAVGLLRNHDRAHTERGRDRRCPYCVSTVPPEVKWT